MTIQAISNCGILAHFQGMWVIQVLVSSFLAIVFIQSGLDKTFHYKGNLDWLKGHFSSSFLAGLVPILLSTLTAIELAAGLTCLFGAIEAVVYKTFCFGFAGSLLSAITLLMLFFGQRVAKDYAGAATLVPYFILVVINLFFLV